MQHPFPSSACPRALCARSPSVTSTPLPDPGARPPRRARRTRHPRQGADRIRARRSASRSRSSSDSSPAMRRPAALVLVPTRELASQVALEFATTRAERRRGRDGLRRRPDPRAGEARSRRARPRRDAGPPERPARAQGNRRSTAFASSSSTRPTGCSTWASSLRSTASCDGSRRRARRCSSPRRSTTRVGELARAYTSDPVRCEAAPAVIEDERGGRAPLRLGQGRRQGRDARRAPARRARARARLRADTARRRTPRQEARVPPGRRRRAPRRSQPGTARAGTASGSSRARRRRSSRRTSRRAGSTSSTSRT